MRGQYYLAFSLSASAAGVAGFGDPTVALSSPNFLGFSALPDLEVFCSGGLLALSSADGVLTNERRVLRVLTNERPVLRALTLTNERSVLLYASSNESPALNILTNERPVSPDGVLTTGAGTTDVFLAGVSSSLAWDAFLLFVALAGVDFGVSTALGASLALDLAAGVAVLAAGVAALAAGVAVLLPSKSFD